jgi:hypothetical protein
MRSVRYGPVGIGLLFSSQSALDVGVFNDDILEFYNTSVDIELIELRALKSPRFPPFYSPFQPLNSGITNTT